MSERVNERRNGNGRVCTLHVWGCERGMEKPLVTAFYLHTTPFSDSPVDTASICIQKLAANYRTTSLPPRCLRLPGFRGPCQLASRMAMKMRISLCRKNSR